MIHYKQPSNGIDEAILKLQRATHDQICCMFGLDAGSMAYQCYGRIYRNRPAQRGGVIPEAYVSDGEYRSVFHDDRYQLMSFVDVDDNFQVDGADNVHDMSIVFFCHLGTLGWRNSRGELVNLPSRNDQEVRSDIQAVFDDTLCGFTMTSGTIGLPAISEYRITSAIGAADQEPTRWDMHPFHVFSINGTMRYPKPNYQNHNFNN